MQVVKEYKVIADTSVDNLNKEVNKLVKLYWQPFGGIAISASEVTTGTGQKQHGAFYAQAMVKY